MRSPSATSRPQPSGITLDSLRAAIKNDRKGGKAIYIRTDAWPALRRELSAQCLVPDGQPALITGRVTGLYGIDIIVTPMPLPKAWCWDFELWSTT